VFGASEAAVMGGVMPVIVTIGYQDYLVRKESDAAAVMRAMAGAVRVQRAHRNGKTIYWPENDQHEVGMKTVDRRCLFDADPREVEVDVDTAVQLPTLLPMRQKGGA